MIATKMEAETSEVKLWQSRADKFAVDMCVICQKATDDATVSTLNGRKRIRDAAGIRNEMSTVNTWSDTERPNEERDGKTGTRNGANNHRCDLPKQEEMVWARSQNAKGRTSKHGIQWRV